VIPKPAHLGPAYAAQFQDASVVAAYHLRPPYPAEVFAILADLLPPDCGAVLDAGCGTGEIARLLIERVARIDAVDLSPAMIAQGRQLPGGGHPRLRWICGPIEDAPLDPPYGLVTAASSIHWMAWDVVLPRFRDVLAPGGTLALVYQATRPVPWAEGLQAITNRYSTNREFQPYDPLTELVQRGLFAPQGTRTTAHVAFVQPVADYVESFHARDGFSRDRMAPDAAAAFDAEVTALLAPFCPAGQVALELTATVTWGVPAPDQR
jgi:SAM-dependent methyltransferase